MRLDDASSPVVVADTLEFGLDVGKIIISICRSFVFDMMGTLQVIFAAVILLCVYVRGKSNMRGSLVEIDGFHLVAVVGHIVFEVVAALVVFVSDYLVLLAPAHEPPLPLIVKSGRGLGKNDVAALAASGIVVGIGPFRSVDALPVFGIGAFGRTFDLAQMILLLRDAIIARQPPLVFTSHGTSPAIRIDS